MTPKLWPFKKTAITTRDSADFLVSYGLPQSSFLTTSYGSPDRERILPYFQSYAEQAYAGNAVVFGVILARLMLFSEAEFIFRANQDGRLFGTQDLALLENPWPNGTTGELLARMEQDVSLAGNAYIRSIDGQRLERLRPDRVVILSRLVDDRHGRPHREVVGYAYDRTGTHGVDDYADLEFYDASEVAHWSPIPDPCAEFRGMSWLTSVVREINADQGLTQHKIQYLEHGATPNLLIKYDRQLKPETINALEDRIQARHGGVANGSRAMVVDSGADVTAIGNSFNQMSFVTVQAAGENRIAAAAGVPGIVVGLKEGLQAATYSNYGQAMRRFADLTMRPQWRSACAALAPLVNVPPAARLWFDTRNIAALQQGEKERAEITLTKAQSIAWLVRFGFEPDTARDAVNGDDLSQLTHTGVPLDATTLVPKAAPPALVLPEPDQLTGATDTTPSTNGNGHG